MFPGKTGKQRPLEGDPQSPILVLRKKLAIPPAVTAFRPEPWTVSAPGRLDIALGDLNLFQSAFYFRPGLNGLI